MIDDDDDDQAPGEALDRAEDALLLDPPGEERRAPNAGSRREYRTRQRIARDVAKAKREFWSRVLADPVGRAELWRILAEDCHAFNERFAVGPAGVPDPLATYLESGKQSIGLKLYQDLLVIDHAGVCLMHLEHDPRFQASRGGK